MTSRGRRGRPLLLSLLSLLLLLLLSRGASASCQTGTAAECRSAAPAPGSGLAGEGYDVVRLAGTGAWVVDAHSWRRRDGTCTLCRNGQMGGALQRLPRAAADWRVSPECRRRVRGALYESEAELTREGASSLDASWSADLSLGPGSGSGHTSGSDPASASGSDPASGSGVKASLAGSQSEAARFARRRSSSDRYSFASQTLRCQLYRSRLGPRPPLSPHFRRLLGQLPRRLGPPTLFFYHRFRRTFGTHYVTGARLGGRRRDVTAVRTCRAAVDGQTAEEVKDCLQVEASARFQDKMEASAKYQSCREASRRAGGKGTFHQEYRDRLIEVVGGAAWAGVDPLFSQDPEALARWVGSLASQPGVIHATLEPLHLLVGRGDPRRANLRASTRQYILQSRGEGGGGNCSSPACPPGARADPLRPCSCRCAQDPRRDGRCCPRGRGWARLGVLVDRGQDLWGDYGSATDAYVKVSLGPRAGGPSSSTGVVANANSPVWNVTLDLGDLQLGPGSGPGLRVEVWDRDNGYDDDLLGSCEPPLAAGTHPHVCYFSYGSLTFQTVLTCAPYLGGATCHDYVARPG